VITQSFNEGNNNSATLPNFSHEQKVTTAVVENYSRRSAALLFFLSSPLYNWEKFCVLTA
jgi:hypothetical protein